MTYVAMYSIYLHIYQGNFSAIGIINPVNEIILV